ncbi:MAG: hypothetical protein HS113_08065 [Verrucomicrobiales bacterium]|nr:hypothetical protein [Verrucomicrobiales bacterium]
MALVQGIREKVHLPIYDSLQVEPEKQLRDVERSSTLKFFVNVQNKTKLETNLQSASLLPHYNTFEARAMRVVISDLRPEFSEEVVGSAEKLEEFEEFDVTGPDGEDLGLDLSTPTNPVVVPPLPNNPPAAISSTQYLTANFEIDLKTLMELLKEARDNEGAIEFGVNDEEVVEVLDANDQEIPDAAYDLLDARGAVIEVTVADLEAMILALKDKAPPLEQVRANDGAGNVISKLIYNTVTTFYVGEKVMIEMPTWNFPGGAGAWSLASKSLSHGEPSPLATFRFAEPIFIDKQQNFRVEIEVPDAEVLKDIQKIYGPLFIWVVLDGYMTRGVQ